MLVIFLYVYLFPANLFTGHLLDTIGRRYCFILSCVPRIVMVLLYLYAKELWLLLVARFLSGILDSVAFTTVSIYASEIASVSYLCMCFLIMFCVPSPNKTAPYPIYSINLFTTSIFQTNSQNRFGKSMKKY